MDEPHGVKLPAPDQHGSMICPESGLKYKEASPGVVCCVDLDEEAPLPAEMARGSRIYGEFKKQKQK